ncbi:hypothetical protein AB0B40_00980 [Streptomyces sp. NPDC042638]|uniref:hypothetical protein n=1 Tax=Streptomyces sp. NPDC042638 TaxID=3154333 RepID=UPI0033C443A9
MGMKARLTLGAVVGIAIIGTVSANAGGEHKDSGSSGSGSGTGSGKASSAPLGRTSGPPTSPASPASSMDGDGGTFKVGTDIAPGTYRSTGNAGGSCSWERTRNAGHGLEPVIAGNHVTGTAVVTISPSDGYFRTTGCGDWKKA